MFSAELEYWLNNSIEPQSVSRRRFAHVRNLYIGDQFRDVTFSAVRDDEKHAAARNLINDRYGWRGYGSDHNIPVDMQHTTFMAEVDQKVIGTITLGVDSGDGLAIDSTFADVADEFRSRPETRVCELTKLAFDCNIRSKEVLAGLFHLAFIYGTSANDCTDLFIEVNPRHARFYEMMLGFCGVGLSRINASVGAPAQLMRLQVEAIGRNIREMAGKRGARSGHSLYPYFFSLDDEVRIRRSLGLSQAPPKQRLEIFAETGSVSNQDIRPSVAVETALKSAA